jgi:hypothetical protein
VDANYFELSLGSGLEFGMFFGKDCAFYGADLEADAAVDAGGKVDPIPVGAFGVFARTLVDAGDGASIDAIGDAFANVGDNCMGHCGSRSGFL